MRILALFALLLYGVLYAKDIIVGVGNAYRPFSYIDEQNEVAGYDVDVLRLIAKYDDSLKFQFNPIPWNAAFVGLDSGKYDMLAYQLTKTKEREEKYIFSDYSYFNDISSAIVKEGNEIKDYKELNAYKIGVSVGSNYALDIENFLKNHPDIKAQIKYYKNPPALIADLGANRIQAVIGEPISSTSIGEAQGIKLRDSGIIINKTPVFFVISKNNAKLKDRISAALKKAIDSGELGALSVKYFGKDLSA